MSPKPSKTLYLVDISSFIFRAFYAIRPLTNSKREPLNAVFGVATMLAKLIQEERAEYIAIAYDSKGPTFREEVYPEYKANRSAPPDDLIPQFARIDELVKCMGLPSFRKQGLEADDLIASLAIDWSQDSAHEVVIVSSDKDLMALVNKQVRLLDTLSSKTYDIPAVQEKYGVLPTQIRDYLGLVGDSSDNIPGVTGIGPKSAGDLLRDFGDLETILKAANAGKIPGKKGETLKAEAKMARLSAELATLKIEPSVKADPQKLRYDFTVGPECVALLKEFEFHTLLEKWQKVGGSPAAKAETPDETQTQLDLGPPAKIEGVDFVTVNTEKALAALIKRIEKAGAFGFDTETTSLNPRAAELVGIAIAVDEKTGYYIPISHRGTDTPQLAKKKVLEMLRPILEDAAYGKIGQNLKYDWSVMREQGVDLQGIVADTMVAAYALQPEGRHNLEKLALTYLDYKILTFEEVCGKGKDQIGFDQVPIEQATRYSGEDAWIALKLWQELEPRLKKEKLEPIFEKIDLPLVPILGKMECQGVCIDEKYLQDLSKEFEKELAKIEKKVQAYTKGDPVNLNSPKQLAKLLFEDLKLPSGKETKTGFSTDAQVLEDISGLHEVPRLLLEFREISKLKGTYVDPLPLLKDAKTGKVHASFHQTVAATGRLSSSDPNLQNIPIRTERGIKIRRAFLPSPGNVLISADYSQIELRILAHMSGDKELKASFLKGEDVHRRTASEIFGVEPESVDDRKRGIAKAINFGLMYGKTAFGLAQELKIPRREAQDVIHRYFERYSGVKKFLDEQIEEAREKGWSSTMSGRKRWLPDIRSKNPTVRGFAERMAMNTPIQGTAADLIKLAMIHLDRELDERKMETKLIIQVHDELVLDSPKKEADRARQLTVEVMENAMQLSVPLSVNSAVGDNWMDL